MQRRTLLRRSVPLAILTLAGCAGDTDEGDPTATTDAGPPTDGAATRTASPEPTIRTDDTSTPTESPTATDSSTETPTATNTPTETPTPAVDADQVVDVGAGGSLRFSPDSFEIATGETVLWRWEAGGHNVRPDSIPEDSSWEGTEGGDGDTYDEGHTHEHTFDVPGEYDYYCGPHRNAGMTGSFTVA